MLSTLHTKGFDLNQIWEQIELLNQPTENYAKKSSKEIVKMTPSCLAILPQAMYDEQSKMKQLPENSYYSYEHPRKLLASGDRFFKISEMNQFLLEEDDKYRSSWGQQPVDDIDLFRELSSEDDELMYDDFFDPPNDDYDNWDCVVDHDLEFDDDRDGHDSDDTTESQNQSTHARQQQKVSTLLCIYL